MDTNKNDLGQTSKWANTISEEATKLDGLFAEMERAFNNEEWGAIDDQIAKYNTIGLALRNLVLSMKQPGSMLSIDEGKELIRQAVSDALVKEYNWYNSIQASRFIADLEAEGVALVSLDTLRALRAVLAQRPAIAEMHEYVALRFKKEHHEGQQWAGLDPFKDHPVLYSKPHLLPAGTNWAALREMLPDIYSDECLASMEAECELATIYIATTPPQPAKKTEPVEGSFYVTAEISGQEEFLAQASPAGWLHPDGHPCSARIVSWKPA